MSKKFIVWIQSYEWTGPQPIITAYYTGVSSEFTSLSIGYKQITINCETLSIMSSDSVSRDISIHV